MRVTWSWIHTWIQRVRHSTGLIVLQKTAPDMSLPDIIPPLVCPLEMTNTPLLFFNKSYVLLSTKKASEPQIVALRRWIPNSPSQDSMPLAVYYTARNEVKWHYLHNIGTSSIFISSADSLFSLERGCAILGNGYKYDWGVTKISIYLFFQNLISNIGEKSLDNVFTKRFSIWNPNIV